MVRSLCSLSVVAAIVASFALTAVADIPPPPPAQGLKRVPLEHVVKLGDEIPGYMFYAFQQFGLNGEITTKELALSKDKGVVVPAADSPSVWMGVLAVPQKIVEQEKTPENLAKLLSRFDDKKLPTGCVVHSSRGTSMDLRETDPRAKVEQVITISADDKAGVKFTVEQPAAVKKATGGESSAIPPAATMFAGAALSVTLVTSGLLWFRRK